MVKLLNCDICGTDHKVFESGTPHFLYLYNKEGERFTMAFEITDEVCRVCLEDLVRRGEIDDDGPKAN